MNNTQRLIDHLARARSRLANFKKLRAPQPLITAEERFIAELEGRLCGVHSTGSDHSFCFVLAPDYHNRTGN